MRHIVPCLLLLSACAAPPSSALDVGPLADAPATPSDAYVPDAGPAPDANAPEDAAPALDAGPPPEDAFVAPPDAATPGADAGACSASNVHGYCPDGLDCANVGRCCVGESAVVACMMMRTAWCQRAYDCCLTTGTGACEAVSDCLVRLGDCSFAHGVISCVDTFTQCAHDVGLLNCARVGTDPIYPASCGG